MGLATWAHEVFPLLVWRLLPVGLTPADANTAVFLGAERSGPREHAAWHVVQYVQGWLDRALAAEDDATEGAPVPEGSA